MRPGSQDNQLAASTVDTVTFTDATQLVEVLGDGSAEIFATVDGTTPVVSGSHCYKIPAVLSAIKIAVPNETAVVVKLISAGTPVYSVTSAS